MKTDTLQRRAVAATVIATTAVLTSCATTGYQRADKTGESMAAFRDDVVNVKKSVDATLAALNKVQQDADINPRKAFTQYTDSLKKLGKAVDTTKARAKQIKEEGDEYFKQWDTQLATVKDPAIRELAEQQKAKLQETYAKIKPLMEQAKADFEPFYSNCQDLQTYLSNDLTVSGIDAAQKLIKQTNEHGDAIQKSLDNLIAEMNTIAATITPAKKTT